MSALTAERLAQLRSLAEKATPGPWRASPNRQEIWQTSHVTRDIWFIPRDEADIDHVAAVDPQTLLALLDEHAAYKAAVETPLGHMLTKVTAERDALQKRLDSAEVYNNAVEEERKRLGLQLHEAKQEWAERCKRQEAGLRAAEAERDDLRKQLDDASDVVITSGIEIGTLQIRAEKAEAALAEARPWCDWCGRRDE